MAIVFPCSPFRGRRSVPCSSAFFRGKFPPCSSVFFRGKLISVFFSGKFSWIDALLLLMALIWGTNFSVIKTAFNEVEPQAFNAVRMILASAVFLTIIVAIRRIPVRGDSSEEATEAADSLSSIFQTPAAIRMRDWLWLIGLGLVGDSCISTSSSEVWRGRALRTVH